MSNRGKEVLKGQLMYRRNKGNSLKKRVVTAYCGCGPGANSNGKAAVAQLTLNEDYEKVEKPGQKPKSMIPLEGAKIDCSYLSGGTIYSNPSRLSASPSPSPHSSSLGGSGGGIISGSGSGSGTVSSGSMYAFSIITQNGDVHEFLSESENDRLRWVKLLQLLLMFPYSTIPDEPTGQPIKESFRAKLDPKKYNADSVWPVFILPEEVGMKCSIIGTNVIALKSGVQGVSIGHLDIYQAADPSTPLISWDRDKMRRTGKTGNLVFIEIGRRCFGGPGLVWMYTGFNDAQALRETLHNFLFKGDGRAVAIPTQVAPIYDVPRSSLDTSLPPSYKRHNSIPGYNNHVLSRSRSHDHDSGYPPSPAGSMNTPPMLDGPPVRLDKHPSIRRKNGSSRARDISRSNSTTSFGSLSERDMFYPSTGRSGDSAEPPLGDGSGDSSRSISPEEDGDVIGQMDPDQPISNGAPYYDSVPRRSSSEGGIPNMQQRIVMPGRGEGPGIYEEMTYPKNGMQAFDGYVVMKPAENGARTMSAPIPMSQRIVPPPADDTYHHLQRRASPQNSSSSPRNRSNYDQLPTISEGRHLRPGIRRTDSSNYENHPLPQDLKGVSVEYRPNYENVEMAKRGRRGSLNQDRYENVDGEQQVIENSNTNNGNSDQKRRFSLRRRSSDKESVSLPLGDNGTSSNKREVPSPVKNGPNDIEGYVVIQSKSESGNVNPDLSSVGYSSINYQSTETLGAMRDERQRQGQYYRSSQVVLSEN